MVKIIIHYADGRPDWVMWVNSIEEAQRWVDEEKTRPYISIDDVFEIIDETPPQENP